MHSQSFTRLLPLPPFYLTSVRPFLSSGLSVAVPLTCHWPVPCAQSAFSQSGLTEIVVPDSVVEIEAVCTTPARHYHHHICLRERRKAVPTSHPRVCGVTDRILYNYQTGNGHAERLPHRHQKGTPPAHPLPVMYPAATLAAVVTCLVFALYVLGSPCWGPAALPLARPLRAAGLLCLS